MEKIVNMQYNQYNNQRSMKYNNQKMNHNNQKVNHNNQKMNHNNQKMIHNNQINNKKLLSDEDYNHVINNLQDYMLSGKLIVSSLKIKMNNNNNGKKINNFDDDKNKKKEEKNKEEKNNKEKECFFTPKEKDQLFWCFYVIKNGFSAYEYPGITDFINEKNEKIKCIDLLRENKQQLKAKKIKNIKEHLEDELVNCSVIGMKTFIGLCVSCNINIMFIQRGKCFEMIYDNDSPIHVVHNLPGNFGGSNGGGKYSYEFDITNEQIEKYRKTMFKWENIEKPLKAIGSYTSDELHEISKQLGLETTDENMKRKTKKSLYEQIVMNL